MELLANMAAFSEDLRARVVDAVENEKMSVRDAADRFKVGKSWVSKILVRFRQTGDAGAFLPIGGPAPKLDERERGWLQEWLRAQPDLTQQQRADRLAAKGVEVDRSTVGRVLRELGWTRKKSLVATERLRPDVQAKRTEWCETTRPALNPEDLVFLDEAGSNVGMTPNTGYAPRGERVVDHAPKSHGTNVSILAAMTWDGPLGARTFDGAVNGPRFLRWIKSVLRPRLWKGAIVVMDNVRFHKVAGVAEALAEVGARALYLPPYSPDLNPIELMWSKVKTLLRQAKARSRDALKAAIRAALRKIKAMDAAAWFVHAGY